MKNEDNLKITKVIAIVPSFNPTETTVTYVEELFGQGFEKIIVVDDGSRDDSKHYFDVLRQNPRCVVLTHAVNFGKGRALKTAFNYFLNHFSKEEAVGVVTADADGQHSAKDTAKVALRLLEEPDHLILGTRDFNEEIVPFKSRNGNKITTTVFSMLYSKKINDTQTGLRGIPYEFVKKCITLSGERFEYEINMLIASVREKVEIKEERIETIYFESNRETHFDTVRDSAKIYALMFKSFLKFMMAGMVSFLIDIGIFAFLTKVVFSSMVVRTSVLLGTVIARIISSLFNFKVNKDGVFKSSGLTGPTMLRYYALVAAQMLLSWLLVIFLFDATKGDTTFIKIIVDFLLFFVSFQVQRRWVFAD